MLRKIQDKIFWWNKEITFRLLNEGSLHDVMVNKQDCDIKVNKFELQLNNYAHFHINTVWKCMNSLILPTKG